MDRVFLLGSSHVRLGFCSLVATSSLLCRRGPLLCPPCLAEADLTAGSRVGSQVAHWVQLPGQVQVLAAAKVDPGRTGPASLRNGGFGVFVDVHSRCWFLIRFKRGEMV